MASSVASAQRSLQPVGSSLPLQPSQHSQGLLLRFSRTILALLAMLSGSYMAWAQVDIFSLARAGSAAQVQSALAAGAFADEQDVFYLTPLMLAAKYNPDPEVIGSLVRAGVSLNRRAINGKTALIYAAAHSSNPAVVLALLEAGADPLLRDHRGLRAADYAANNPVMASRNLVTQLEQRSNRPQSSEQVSRTASRTRVIVSDVAMPRPPEAVFFRGQSPISLRDVQHVGRARRWFE